MITFPLDPRITNPLWSILFKSGAYFPYLRGTVPNMLRDIKKEYEFEVPDIPMPVIDVVETESKSPKDKGEAVNVVSEKIEKVNRLAVMWAQYNHEELRSKKDGMEWFLGEYAPKVGLLFVSVDQFEKTLTKSKKSASYRF